MSKSDSSGYTFVEVTIVVIVIAVLATTAVVNLGPMIVSLDVEQVAAEVAANLGRARRAALSGTAEVQPRRFSVSSAVAGRHPGIIVTNVAPASIKNCQPNCQIQSICLADRPFCFAGSNEFTFEKLTGRVPEAQAIFIISKSRKLAVLVSAEGKTDLVEQINGQWKTSSELQKLIRQ